MEKEKKQYPIFRLARNIVVKESYAIEAVDERHAKVRIKKLLDTGRAPEPAKTTVRVGHFKVED